jgi:glucosamine kinase
MKSEMRMHVLGIDAGGTKTRVIHGALESGDASLLKEYQSRIFGPANFRQAGSEGIARLIADITVELAGGSPAQTVVVAGFAGVGTSDAEQAVRQLFENQGYTHPSNVITSDVGLLLRALQNNGILLVAGTGSICMGRVGGRESSTIRAGGWGFRLGDAGSAYHLGIKALETAAKIHDCILPRTASSLYDAVMSHFYFSTFSESMGMLYPEDVSVSVQEAVAGFAPVVVTAAHQGDVEAERIVSETTEALASYVDSVYRGLTIENPTVGLFGGLFSHPLADTFFIPQIFSRPMLEGLNADVRHLQTESVEQDPLTMAIRYSLAGAPDLETP